MKVPVDAVPERSLINMLEEFVTRDGTDYGEREVPVRERVIQVHRLLERGEIVIWYDETTETLSLFARDQIPSP